MVGVPNEVFSGVSFVAFVTCVIPLYWHLEAWNIGTCMFIFWAGFGSLNFFINSIIWNHNVVNWAPVWCDISTRFITGISIGIPATSLAINRRLYKISAVRAVLITRSERRREMIIDFAISLGFPCIIMALQYVVQGHRFNIYEDIGCLPYTWNTPLAYVLLYMWPLITGLCAATYCMFTIRNFWKRGKAMREVLSTHSNLNQGRYIRLMALAAMEMFATIPLTIYIIYSNATLGGAPLPWKSWEDTHSGFSKVDQFPRVLWGDDSRIVMNLELQRWLTVACAFVFVAFFGFADEARKHYRAAYTSLASRLGVTTISSGSFSDSTGYGSGMSKGMAINISTSGPRIKRDSFASGLSTTISLGDFDESSFMDREKEQYAPRTPDSPNSPDSPFSPTAPYTPTMYSPTDGDESRKVSPIEATPTNALTLPVSTHMTRAMTSADVPIIRAPEAAVRRPRPESEIVAVDRSSEYAGASAV